MAAAAADAKKKLPKELQDYKREIKKLPFKDKIKAYFDCAPFISDLDSQKQEVIISTFTKEGRKEFYRRYEPIHSAIERYGDRVRAIDRTRMIYANYIDSALRQRDAYLYTADYLNLLLSKTEEALKGTEEANTRETLTEALRILRNYNLPRRKIELNYGRNLYEVPTEEEDKFLLGAINTLKRALSLLKSYLEALKEFLEWVGTPELLPREFKDMETDLLTRFHGYKPQKTRDQNPDADKFPLFFGWNRVANEYLSIDYEDIPKSINISGERNLFANAYRRIFNY